MTKRLVVCCDGTWGRPDARAAGRPCPTNVTKLALAVAGRDPDGVEQRVYYHPGVGTRRGERFRGGIFGFGLSRDVLSAYRFVLTNYEPGDELFLFGFSRGAYTARSVVGLIKTVGVLHGEYADRLDDAYALYRDRGPKERRELESLLFRRSYSYETGVRFVGVWDTVGALGIPWSDGLTGWINRRWSFHDLDLSPAVEGAFQALAIDERRRPFEPAIWKPDPDAPNQRVEQVWFAGSHCDVGGGYPDAALADVTLRWLADRAGEYGLALRPDAFEPQGGWGTAGSPLPAVGPDAFGPLHSSWRGLYRLTRPLDRPIGKADPAHEYAAGSAVLRRGPGYAPPQLERYLAGPHQVTAVPGCPAQVLRTV